ncbi:SET domain-containing protein [Abeliophyllum distichum]|uniref:SET domain-containing protein n=1 Tax=Abeliophyllum distichum TaxID=126358 RepID=A0ABD1V6L7_9LAMI
MRGPAVDTLDNYLRNRAALYFSYWPSVAFKINSHLRTPLAAPPQYTSMAATRRMRAFKRWMKCQGIEFTVALNLAIATVAPQSISVSVKALCDLQVGDVVARIPKQSCLTVKTSGAHQLIEESQLGGYLGLSVAIMYEKSLGPQSPWFQYLQLLPPIEPIPLLWSFPEIDFLLSGTELHKIIKEDKALVYEDWKECIEPLLGSALLELNPEFFSVQEYFAARSLISSRSFEIDKYHGFGMVPLADLFNHKTAAEDVHFTAVSSHSESDNDADNDNRDFDDVIDGDDEPIAQDSHSEKDGFSVGDMESSLTSEDDPRVLEMIMIKDVKAGAEVFNTYGSLGNAALLHRYGFTELDNPFDIVNIDLELVLQWSSSLFSCRHSRRRLSLWRKLDYSGCGSQNSEYFEISFDGEPEVDLLVLLYIMLLPEEAYNELDLALSAVGNLKKSPNSCFTGKGNLLFIKGSVSKNLLLTKDVCVALLSLADSREAFYGLSSLDDDTRSLKECCRATEYKLYHSLILRISERRILKKLRCYAAAGARIPTTAKGANFKEKSEEKMIWF